MTTILFTFVLALGVSLAATPLAGRLGIRFGAMDLPDQRKIHSVPTPRTGGVAISTAVFASVFLISLGTSSVSSLLSLTPCNLCLIGGSLIALCIGLFDDFRRLGPSVKFGFQILAASLAYGCGVRVEIFALDPVVLEHVLNYGSTVCWFLLLINAINLIDGLDGLAGGIVFFACLLMVIMSTLGQRYVPALLFAALGGATLGFLRYNFNPATIFLGDGGSYFIGYAIAAVSILGSGKSQLSAGMLIPILSLGVPLFDTLVAPLRRFVRGKSMFHPDKRHLHHRLLQMGLNTRRCVLLIYGFTALLGLAAVVAVNLQDEKAGLFLLILGAGCFLAIRKMGYFDYLGSEKIASWARDVSEEFGLSRSRRVFLDLQIEIEKSENHDRLWSNIVAAVRNLDIGLAEMALYKNRNRPEALSTKEAWEVRTTEGSNQSTPETEMGASIRQFHWNSPDFVMDGKSCESCMMKLELPLICSDPLQNFGILWLTKDLKNKSISHHTLRGVEHLRRTITRTLACLHESASAELCLGEDRGISQKSALTILLVDDDVNILKMLKRTFTIHGFGVLTATDGRAAMKLVQNNAIDGALLDINLPEMTGLGLCAEIKYVHPQATIMAFTGFPTLFESRRCQNVGFDGYFSKPVNPYILVKQFKESLGKVRYSRLAN